MIREEVVEQVIKLFFCDMPKIIVTTGNESLVHDMCFSLFANGSGMEQTRLSDLWLDLRYQKQLAEGMHPILFMNTDVRLDEEYSAEELLALSKKTKGYMRKYEVVFAPAIVFPFIVQMLDGILSQDCEVICPETENGSLLVTPAQKGEPLTYIIFGTEPLRGSGDAEA